MQQYNFMVIDPHLDRRMKLRQAAQHVSTFSKFFPANTFTDALRLIQSDQHTDVFFISEKLPFEEISTFIASAKNTNIGGDAAYVLVTQNGEKRGDLVARYLLAGVDGFLEEPYSVDGLVEVTLLTAKLKKEYSLSRKKTAVQMLLNEIMKQITTIAQIKSCSQDITRCNSKVEELFKSVDQLDDEAKNIFLELAPDVFENAPLPANIPTVYRGTSARAKKKMEAKASAKLINDLNGA